MNTDVSMAPGWPRAEFERLIGDLRPKLHRYCARMTGSVIDGEDVVQEAILKAIEAHPTASGIDNPSGWLFRIAHNTALDFLRRRARLDRVRSDEDPDMIIDATAAADQRLMAAVSLRTFMRLPPAQRGCVILMDVLDYTLEDIAAVMDTTVPAVKASLHRGRAALRRLAGEPDEGRPPMLSQRERSLLDAYVDRFNARDFDAVRDMLADEARLELVGRTRLKGRQEITGYFGNYCLLADWRFASGTVDGRLAAIAFDPRHPSAGPIYVVLLGWAGDKVATIRDFRYARYVTDGAALELLEKRDGTATRH